jgi:hypothetical protein
MSGISPPPVVGNRINGPFTDVLCSKRGVTADLVVTVAGAELQSVLNIREKPALLRKQGGFTPVLHTSVKPHTGDPHKFNASINQTKLRFTVVVTY